jgi:WD40 repeat protein
MACGLVCFTPLVLLDGLSFLRVLDRGQCAAAVESYNNRVSQEINRQSIPFDLEYENLAIISPSNVHRVVELQHIGRGFVRDAFWAADGGLYVLTSVGMWKHDALNLDSSPELLWTYDEGIFDFTVSPDGRFLVIHKSSYVDAIPIWDTATGDPVKTLQIKGNSEVQIIAFNHQGTQIAAVIGHDVYLWDIASGNRIATFTDFTDRIDNLAFSDDGRLLAAGGADQFTTPKLRFVPTLRIWELASNNILTSMQVEQGNGVWRLAFSPDGNILASAGGLWNENIRLWDVRDGHQISVWPTESEYEDYLAFNRDGTLLIRRTQVYDVITGKRLTTLGEGEWSRFSPDGSLIVTVLQGYRGKTELTVWDAKTFAPLVDLEKHYRRHGFNTLEFDSANNLYGFQVEDTVSPDNAYLALREYFGGSSDGVTYIRFCDVHQKKQIAIFDGGSPMTFSYDNALLATTDYCGGLSLRNGQNGEMLRTLRDCADSASQITSMAFSSNDKLIAVPVANYYTEVTSLQFWDVTTSELVASLTAHTSRITSVAFTNDDRLIATSSLDGTVRLWGIPGV